MMAGNVGSCDMSEHEATRWANVSGRYPDGCWLIKSGQHGQHKLTWHVLMSAVSVSYHDTWVNMTAQHVSLSCGLTLACVMGPYIVSHHGGPTAIGISNEREYLVIVISSFCNCVILVVMLSANIKLCQSVKKNAFCYYCWPVVANDANIEWFT